MGRALLAVVAAAAVAGAAEWQNIDRAVLERRAPRIDPEAGAEIIAHDIFVEGGGRSGGWEVRHHVVTKIYTDQGASDNGDLVLVNLPWAKYSGVRARTIQPDGAVSEVDKTDLLEREIVRVGRKKIKAKTLALPGVRAGTVIETEYRIEIPAQLLILHMQDDYPAWRLSLSAPDDLAFERFRCKEAKREEGRGRVRLEFTDVAAFTEEPLMPAELRARPWIGVFRPGPDALFTTDPAPWIHAQFKDATKADEEVAAEARRITAGAESDLEKLRRLDLYCKTEIRRVDAAGADEDADKAAKWKTAKRARDTLRRREGTAPEVFYLFAAMARSLGFDPHLVRSADREGPPVVTPRLDFRDFFFSCYSTAIEAGGEWHFFDPSQRWLPAGMLRWQEERTEALIYGKAGTVAIVTPAAKASESGLSRVAEVEVLADGSMAGAVKIRMKGHPAAAYREIFARMKSRQERLEFLQKGLDEAEGALPLRFVNIENEADATKDLVLTATIRDKSYATRTGSRLMIAPAIFRKGAKPWFKAEKRSHPIQIEYGYEETDEVKILAPEGYRLEQGRMPGELVLPGIGVYQMTIGAAADGRTVHVRRRVVVGEAGGGTLEPEHYPALKKWSDQIHRLDQTTLVFRKVETGPPAGGGQ
jgi:hypothetical protein